MGNLDRSSFGRIRTMHGVLTNRFCMNFSDRAWGRFRRVGRTHDVTITRNGVFSFKHLDHHRPGDHEFHELTEERPLAMDGIKGLRLVAADSNPFLRDDAKASLFEHGIDGAGNVPGGGIRLDDRKGPLDGHGHAPHTSAMSLAGPPVAPFTFANPTTSVAPERGTLSRFATFSRPHRPDGSQWECTSNSLEGS